MATQRLERGFVTDYPDKMPPKSSPDFEWPGRKSANAAQRQAFRKTLMQQLHGRGLNHREFAEKFWGQGRTSSGYIAPRNAGTVVKWLAGDSWPTETTAQLLGAFFKVPMERLLVDDGKPSEPFALIRPTRATAATRRKMNGHGGNGGAVAQGAADTGAPASVHSDPAPQLPPRPADWKPAQLHVDACPDAPGLLPAVHHRDHPL